MQSPSTFSLLILLLVIVLAYFIYCSFNSQIVGGLQRLLILTQKDFMTDIKNGKKTVEVRVGGLDFYSKHIGRIVKVGAPGGEKIKAKLVGVKHYETLEELVKKEGGKNIIPSAKSDKEVIEQYNSFKDSKGLAVYDPDKIKERGGVVALHIEII